MVPGIVVFLDIALDVGHLGGSGVSDELGVQQVVSSQVEVVSSILNKDVDQAGLISVPVLIVDAANVPGILGSVGEDNVGCILEVSLWLPATIVVQSPVRLACDSPVLHALSSIAFRIVRLRPEHVSDSISVLRHDKLLAGHEAPEERVGGSSGGSHSGLEIEALLGGILGEGHVHALCGGSPDVWVGSLSDVESCVVIARSLDGKGGELTQEISRVGVVDHGVGAKSAINEISKRAHLVRCGDIIACVKGGLDSGVLGLVGCCGSEGELALAHEIGAVCAVLSKVSGDDFVEAVG